jgi:hypothetical protein
MLDEARRRLDRVVIDRNVFEWRLDPACRHGISQTGYDRRIIIVCNEGYSSTLAAATLRTLGLQNAPISQAASKPGGVFVARLTERHRGVRQFSEATRKRATGPYDGGC